MKKVLLVGLIAALVAAGCGDDDGDEDQAVEEAAQAYVTALQERDFETACSFISEEELEERHGGLDQCIKSMDATTPEEVLEGFEITGTHEGDEGQTIVEFETANAPPNSFEFMTQAEFTEFEEQEEAEAAEEAGDGKGSAAEAEEAEESEEGESSKEGDRWVFFEG